MFAGGQEVHPQTYIVVFTNAWLVYEAAAHVVETLVDVEDAIVGLCCMEGIAEVAHDGRETATTELVYEVGVEEGL